MHRDNLPAVTKHVSQDLLLRLEEEPEVKFLADLNARCLGGKMSEGQPQL